jgi:type VI secretion system protein ImpF
VREPRRVPGLKTPLFDRLLDDGINVRQPVSPTRSLDMPSLRESVRADLSRLLNTRTNLRGAVKDLASGTVLDYGIPSLSPISPASDDDRRILAELLEKIVAQYEPRLRSVRILVQQDKTDPRALIGVVYGNLVSGNEMENVYFPLALDSAAKKVDVGGSVEPAE